VRRRTVYFKCLADAVPCECLLRQEKPGSLGKEARDATLKFEDETQWVQVPRGQSIASRPQASLGRRRVTQPLSVDSEHASRVIEPRKHEVVGPTVLSEPDGSIEGLATGERPSAYRGRRAGRACKGFPGTWEILPFPAE